MTSKEPENLSQIIEQEKDLWSRRLFSLMVRDADPEQGRRRTVTEAELAAAPPADTRNEYLDHPDFR